MVLLKRRNYHNVKGDIKLNQVFSKLAYSKHRGKDLKKYNTDYKFHPTLSTREHAVFTHPSKHRAVIAYRGTDMADKKRWHKDVRSDFLIATGLQNLDPRHRQAHRHLQKVKSTLKGYDIDVTGHSLGGSVANYVTKKNPDVVKKSIAFSRGTGPMELLQKKSNRTIDVSNKYDPISMFARLQGGKQYVNKNKSKSWGVSGLLNHNIEATTRNQNLGSQHKIMTPSGHASTVSVM